MCLDGFAIPGNSKATYFGCRQSSAVPSSAPGGGAIRPPQSDVPTDPFFALPAAEAVILPLPSGCEQPYCDLGCSHTCACACADNDDTDDDVVVFFFVVRRVLSHGDTELGDGDVGFA